MPKPTSQQPPGLTEPRIMDRCPGCGSQSLFLGTGGLLTCYVIGCKAVSLAMWLEKARQAGCEAQRKVDAEIARWHIQCAKKAGGLDDEDVRECAKEITEAIERTPEQPTTGEACSCPNGDHLDGCYLVERR